MSFDLTIKADETYSRFTPLLGVVSFLKTLPKVKPNGERGFVFTSGKKRWMEIDLEVVNKEGDNIEDSNTTVGEVNCVRLHIPYSMLGENLEADYLPTAFAIAERLGWSLCDDQTGEILSKEPIAAAPAAPGEAQFDPKLFVGEWIAWPYSFAPSFRGEFQIFAAGRFEAVMYDPAGEFFGSARGTWALIGDAIQWSYEACKKIPRPRRPQVDKILESSENRFVLLEKSGSHTEFWRRLPSGDAMAAFTLANLRSFLESLIKPIEGGFATREIDEVMAKVKNLKVGQACQLFFPITEKWIVAPLRIAIQTTDAQTFSITFTAPIEVSERIQQQIRRFQR